MSIPDRADWYDMPERWVACIDLLGFKEKFQQENWQAKVHSTYGVCLHKLLDCARPGVEQTWFSDTFIFFTDNNSKRSFELIEERSRNFVNGLIQYHIPLRGALAEGRFLAHQKSKTYVGPALIDAYQHAEAQDWIGYVVTPSARKKMQELGVDYDLPYPYRNWPIPWKNNFASGQMKALLIGLSMHSFLSPSHREENYNRLKEMCDSAATKKIKKKYLNTMEFLKKSLDAH